MPYHLSIIIYLIVALLPVVAGGRIFKQLDQPSKIFYWLLSVSFLTECAAYFAAVRYRNNMPVYNISNMIQIFLIALYYNYILKPLTKGAIGIYIAVLSVFIGILDLAFIEHLNSYNSYYFLFQTLLVAAFGMALLLQYMLFDTYFKFQQSPHFWFALILMFFYTVNFLNLSLYDYFTVRLGNNKHFVDTAIYLFNIITNIGFASVFFLYSKMTKGHVR